MKELSQVTQMMRANKESGGGGMGKIGEREKE